MIDYEKIGKRIYEERKFIRHLSQEKMAEALGMYQADISNLEKAKRGSGITDLTKLDMIADYFDIPLENLIFGGNVKKMVKYYGKEMEIKLTKRFRKGHKKVLSVLTGASLEQFDTMNVAIYEWGPYVIYVLTELQYSFGNESKRVDGQLQPEFVLPKLHTYIFLENEVIGAFVTSVTTVMQHVYRPHLVKLQQMIPFDILDITDCYRTLNPYWALWQFTDGEESDANFDLMHKRMDEIRACGQEDKILYIESAYVREDYRQTGMFRLFVDLMRKACGDCIMWLNMEPTSGGELTKEYTCLPAYTSSELGQLSLNASIAERTGFTVDPDTWHRQAEVLGNDGQISTEVVLVRKCAYYLPEKWKNLIQDDGDLVAVGRAKQKIYYSQLKDRDDQIDHDAIVPNESFSNSAGSLNGKIVVDMNTGIIEGYKVSEWKETCISGPDIGKCIAIFAAWKVGEEKYLYGVSKNSLFVKGIDANDFMEQYEYLDDALESDYFDKMQMLNMQLMVFDEKNEEE